MASTKQSARIGPRADRPSRTWQTAFLAAMLMIAAGFAGYVVLEALGQPGRYRPRGAAVSRLKLADIPFDGAAAYGYLKQICALGPRISGTQGMFEQQKMLEEHFTKLGAKVVRQEFQARHPQTGQAVPMTNMLIQWHPDRKERVLLVAHYDTRPYPDRDPVNPRGVFLGANDGASGVALLMELGKSMPDFDGNFGIDFLLVDGEELVVFDRNSRYFGDPGDPYCLGSTYFARQYAADPPPYHYRWAVVLDMVGGANLQLLKERLSYDWPDTRPLVDAIWGMADKLGVKEFVSRVRRDPINDDHVPLHDIAGIPACDIIDMDFRQWHTTRDTPAHCSALSLAKVGWVVQEWLKSL